MGMDFYSYDLQILSEDIESVFSKTINNLKRKISWVVLDEYPFLLKNLRSSIIDCDLSLFKMVLSDIKDIFIGCPEIDFLKRKYFPLICISDLQCDVECLGVQAMYKGVKWILDLLYFDDGSRRVFLGLCLIEIMKIRKIHLLPLNFLNLMVVFECDNVLTFLFDVYIPEFCSDVFESNMYFETYIMGILFNVNQIDTMSSKSTLFHNHVLYGQTPLTLAISKVDYRNVNDKILDSDAFEESSKTASGIIVLILEANVFGIKSNVNKKNAIGWTPLCLAIQYRNWKLVEDLLSKFDVDPGLCSNVFGRNIFPVYLATEKENMELATELYSKIFERDAGRTMGVYCLMHEIVSRGDVPTLTALYAELCKHSNCSSELKNLDLNLKDEHGNSILHYAIERGDIDIFNILFEWNLSLAVRNPRFVFDVLLQNSNGDTVFHILARNANRLIDNNSVYSWWDFLDVASRLNTMMNLRMSALRTAVCRDIKYNFDLNIVNDCGETGLHILASAPIFKLHARYVHWNGNISYNESDRKKYEVLRELTKFYVEVIGFDINVGVRVKSSNSRHGYMESANIQFDKIWGRNTLMLAVQNHNVSLYRYLFTEQRYNLDILHNDYYGNSILHVVSYGSWYYFDSLTELILDNFCVSYEQDWRFGITLFDGRKYIMEEICKIWLENEAVIRQTFGKVPWNLYRDINWMNRVNEEGQTALHVAVSQTSMSRPARLVSILVTSFKARCDIQNMNDEIPIMIAVRCHKENYDMLVMLVSGVNVCLTNVLGKNIIHIICEKVTGKKSTDLCRLLLSGNKTSDFICSLNAKDLHGNMPLHFAIEKENRRLCIYLMETGAQWYGFNHMGHSVFHFACREFKDFLHDAYVWKAKYVVFAEAFTLKSKKKKCTASVLDNDIGNFIYAVGFNRRDIVDI